MSDDRTHDVSFSHTKHGANQERDSQQSMANGVGPPGKARGLFLLLHTALVYSIQTYMLLHAHSNGRNEKAQLSI